MIGPYAVFEYEPNAETLKAAQAACERIAKRKAEEALMTPEERAAAYEQWVQQATRWICKTHFGEYE